MSAVVPKSTLSLDKEAWHPSVLPGQVVLISTVDASGVVDLAPKSWITMVAFSGPILAFGCNKGHQTYRNIVATGEFVVNVPREGLAERIWAMTGSHGEERLRRSSLNLDPATRVRPPLVRECGAHLECLLAGTQEFGDEVLIFGRVASALVDDACRSGPIEQQYLELRPLFFLESGVYGAIDAPKRIGRAWPMEQGLFMVELESDQTAPPEVVDRHLEFLRDLRARGKLVFAGVFPAEPGSRSPDHKGLYVLSAADRDEALRVAQEDPSVRAGSRLLVTPWTRTF